MVRSSAKILEGWSYHNWPLAGKFLSHMKQVRDLGYFLIFSILFFFPASGGWLVMTNIVGRVVKPQIEL